MQASHTAIQNGVFPTNALWTETSQHFLKVAVSGTGPDFQRGLGPNNQLHRPEAAMPCWAPTLAAYVTSSPSARLQPHCQAPYSMPRKHQKTAQHAPPFCLQRPPSHLSHQPQKHYRHWRGLVGTPDRAIPPQMQKHDQTCNGVLADLCPVLQLLGQEPRIITTHLGFRNMPSASGDWFSCALHTTTHRDLGCSMRPQRLPILRNNSAPRTQLSFRGAWDCQCQHGYMISGVKFGLLVP